MKKLHSATWKMKRLFFALWPDEAVREQCAKLAQSIVRSGEKSVRPENLHVTLTFLGNIDAETEESVLQAASAITPAHLNITFNEVSYWRRPRILCLSGQTEGAELGVLVGKLTALSRKLDIPVDSRPYSPHVTLVRKAKSPRDIMFEPILWTASGFCLVESHSSPNGGTVYEIIKNWEA
ncbi:MAG: RNA 2',3'-cyclic phosphodiesterase, partial [Gammaproteobacteria bacterium]